MYAAEGNSRPIFLLRGKIALRRRRIGRPVFMQHLISNVHGKFGWRWFYARARFDDGNGAMEKLNLVVLVRRPQRVVVGKSRQGYEQNAGARASC